MLDVSISSPPPIIIMVFKCAHATAVYVVFIPDCRKCVYIDEANQGTNSFQEVNTTISTFSHNSHANS